MIRTMARKHYSDEFRRQAVDLYESSPGASLRGIADDLALDRATLRGWVETLGTGTKTAEDGTPTRSPLKARPRPVVSASTRAAGDSETPEQQIARLEARVVSLETETEKLTTEREILRSAARYFAGETRW